MQPSLRSWSGSFPFSALLAWTRGRTRATVTALQYPLFSSTTEGEQNRNSSCWGNRVSFVVFYFCFPLRLEVSLLVLGIKTKAEVRDAARSWKLGVKRNEECFFADWPIIVVLMVSS